MKINRIFLAMMAAGLLVGCSNDDSPVNGGVNGEVKTSYVSVDVKGTAATRAAADGGYAEGSVDEQKVTSAHFFFFKADGSPMRYIDLNTEGWQELAVEELGGYYYDIY
jgi:major membrane immunogen (membrane-anchored lipoprotein)